MFSRATGVLSISAGALVVAGGFLLTREAPTVSAAQTGRTSPVLELAREDWTALYEQASLPQMREELEALRHFLFEETNAYYEERFQAGDYEIVTVRRPDGSYVLESGDELAAW